MAGLPPLRPLVRAAGSPRTISGAFIIGRRRHSASQSNQHMPEKDDPAFLQAHSGGARALRTRTGQARLS
jgi:hypothetical protein